MSATEMNRHNQSVLRELEPGDMVEIPRGIYSHWGIYAGDDKIIHLTGNREVSSGSSSSSSSGFFKICGKNYDIASVCEDNFWDVVKGSKARKNNGKDKHLGPLNISEIIRNARSRIGRIGYNALWNNCEHFASWCRYGKSWSEQADAALTGVMVGGAAVAVGGMLAAAYSNAKK